MDSAVLFERDVAYEAGALLSPSSKSIHNVSPYEAVLGVPECGMQATVPWLSRERWETLLLDTHAVLARYAPSGPTAHPIQLRRQFRQDVSGHLCLELCSLLTSSLLISSLLQLQKERSS
jgi:hypothetical protein